MTIQQININPIIQTKNDPLVSDLNIILEFIILKLPLKR
jgi:hypothetical protein